MYVWRNAQELADWLFSCSGPCCCMYQGKTWDKPRVARCRQDWHGMWAMIF